MHGRTTLVVSGVLLAVMVAAAPERIEPGVVPGSAGLLVGVGGLYLESLEAESWRTRSLEAGVVVTLFGSLHYLLSGPDLFFCLVTLAALFVAQSAVIVWSGPEGDDKRSRTNHSFG